MFCISFASADRIDDDLEMTMVCHRPEGLEQLEAQTNFSKRELQVLYRGFKNVSGPVCATFSGLRTIKSDYVSVACKEMFKARLK